MTWDDLRKFSDRPAAYVPHTKGDLIVIGLSSAAVRAYLDKNLDGQASHLMTIYEIFRVYDGDLFEAGGGTVTFI